MLLIAVGMVVLRFVCFVVLVRALVMFFGMLAIVVRDVCCSRLDAVDSDWVVVDRDRDVCALVWCVVVCVAVLVILVGIVLCAAGCAGGPAWVGVDPGRDVADCGRDVCALVGGYVICDWVIVIQVGMLDFAAVDVLFLLGMCWIASGMLLMVVKGCLCFDGDDFDSVCGAADPGWDVGDRGVGCCCARLGCC